MHLAPGVMATLRAQLLLNYPELQEHEFRVLAFDQTTAGKTAQLDLPKHGRRWFLCKDLELLDHPFDQFAITRIGDDSSNVSNVNWVDCGWYRELADGTKSYHHGATTIR